MTATDRIASKAARQMADIVIDNLGEVDEVIIGTPAELKRELAVIGMVKLYVRVGGELREHLAMPISVLYRLLDHLVRTIRPLAEPATRSADEEIESALINLLQGKDTRRYAQTRPLRLVGTYVRGDEREVAVEATWWSDNTVRLKRAGLG